MDRPALDDALIGGREKRKLVIVDYHPGWPAQFERERARVRNALGAAALSIEHIGSTAVPELAAKPVIDLLVTVADPDDDRLLVAAMESAGYELRVRQPGHRMFRTPARDVHVHLWASGSPEVERYLTFRDQLRRSADDRLAYERLKRELATRDWADMNEYAHAKGALIERIISKARRCANLRRVSLLPDYSRQAQLYDRRRRASPSVVRRLREGLAGAPGRRLADVGGGTGNYALALKQEGWDPVVVDRSPEMLARAAAKGLETIAADAQALPFEDETFDAVTMISMLHHVEDRGAALGEPRRILRSRGRLVLLGFTADDAASLWVLDYFPSSRAWMEATHPPLSSYLEHLPGAETVPFRFEDMEDASLAALSADPEQLVAAGGRGETSYFERMQRDHADELRRGLERLREDIAGGRAPRRAGTATMLSWTKP